MSDNTLILASTITMMAIVPGAAIFYTSLTNKKNQLTTVSQMFLAFSMGCLTWGLLSYSLANGNKTIANGFIGDCTYCGMRQISGSGESTLANGVKNTGYFAYNLILAGISPMIMVSQLVGRVRLAFIYIIVIGYSVIIYAPIFYWVRNVNGWLYKMDVIDSYGGFYVHIAAGFATLGSSAYLGQGQNKIYKKNSMSMLLTMIGIGLLWFGWLGFSGGALSAVAITNTHFAACSGALIWTFVQYLFRQQTKLTGWCSGAVCGLVAATASAGYTALWASIVIGGVGALISYIYTYYKTQIFGQNQDTLDVFACHGISGAWGSIAAGIFTSLDSGNTVIGLFYGQGRIFGVNILATFVCCGYSFLVTIILYFILSRLLQPKVPGEEEIKGFDYLANEQNEEITLKEIERIVQHRIQNQGSDIKNDVPKDNNKNEKRNRNLKQSLNDQLQKMALVKIKREKDLYQLMERQILQKDKKIIL